MKKNFSKFLLITLASLSLWGCQPKISTENLLSDDPLLRTKVQERLKTTSDKKKVELVPALVNSLHAVDSKIVNRAVDSLMIIGALALPELKKELSNSDAFIRSSIVGLIGNMGDKAAEALPDLVKALSDPHPLVREEAALTIPKLGTTAQTVVPQLIPLLSDNNKDVSAAARESLTKIGTPEALKALKTKKPSKLHA